MPTVAELMAALPKGEDELDVRRQTELQALWQTLTVRPLPVSGARRMFSLGDLSVRMAMAYVAYWIRSWYRPAGARERDLLETNLSAALQTLETMGYLRGAVAKFGQFLTSFPTSLPRSFVEALGHLHFQAPPMHFSLMREMLLSELGDPEELFESLDPQPIAAASLGQVHRATPKSGELVAVKIQYPGISRAVRADLRTLKLLMQPLRVYGQWDGVEALFDELRVGIERETDYVQEARNLHDVRQILEGDDRFVVPRVYESLSTQRVLTMEYVKGPTLWEFVAGNPSQELRDRAGELITTVLFRIYLARMLHSDTHPGNFIFMPDGRLGCIDLGNLRRFDDAEWQWQRDVWNAKHGPEQDIRAICIRSLQMTDDDVRANEEMLQLVIETFRYYNEPQFRAGPFDFGDESYLRRGAELLARACEQRWLRQTPSNVFNHRLNFQLPALLFQLKSRVDVHRIVQDEVGPDGRLP